MSRTSFYSMFHDILEEKEQKIFKHLVEKDIFIEIMSGDLTQLAKDVYPEDYRDKYFQYYGIPLISKVTKYSRVIQTGYGSDLENQNKGPRIGEWLTSIYEGGGVHPSDSDIETDLMSRPTGGSASMGRFQVEEDYGKKDTDLVRFEVRGSKTGTVVEADRWVPWVEERFKNAAKDRSRTDIPDDPSTPDENESTSTGLEYDKD
jgi:hypothetical protein